MQKLPRKMSDRLALRFGSAMGALLAIPKARLDDYVILPEEGGQWRIAERTNAVCPECEQRFQACEVCGMPFCYTESCLVNHKDPANDPRYTQ